MQHYGYNQYYNTTRRPPSLTSSDPSMLGVPPSPHSHPSPHAPALPNDYYVMPAPPPWSPLVAQVHSAYAPSSTPPPAAAPWPTALLPPQASLLPQLEVLNIGGPPESHPWYMDTSATSHLASDTCILNSIFNSRNLFPNHVIIGNRSTSTNKAIDNASLPHTSFKLSNTLIPLFIVKNLISVRQFTRPSSGTL